MIRNNVEGYEREVLERFEEPTWNNPVVRFVDAKQKDLIPRKDRVWKTGPLLARMEAALEAAERPVPDWFRAVALEVGTGDVDVAAFAMT
ncbi:MAG: hypothetical protein GY711_34830 [bacterium]|nr:hypothetical protein [bacterium]